MSNVTVNNLPEGKCLLVSGRKVGGNKIQLEFAEHVISGTQRSAVGLFNKSDERFKIGGPRRAWMSGEKVDILNALEGQITEQALASIEAQTADEDGKYSGVELNILSPTYQGKELRVSVLETTKPNEWEQANVEVAAKRAGADGEFIVTPNGQHIYSRTNVVVVEPGYQPKHTFLEGVLASELETASQPAQPMFAGMFNS